MNKKVIVAVSIVVAIILVIAVAIGVLFKNFKPFDNSDNKDISKDNSSYNISGDDNNNSGSDGSVKADDTVIKIPVNVTENPGMIAAQFRLFYDADKFDYVNCENGNIFSASSDFNVSESQGKVECLVVAEIGANSTDIKKTGTLVTLTLRPKSTTASGQYEITLDEKSQFANIEEKFVTPKIEIPKAVVK